MTTLTSALPVPSWERSDLVVEPPEARPGAWVGSPSAVLVDEGGPDDGIYLAYRVRLPIGEGRGVANVVARSTDGVRFETVGEVTKEQFDCESLERPALVRVPGAGWRLYVSAATYGTKHWRVELVEAADPAGLGTATPRVVLPGDDTIAVKDPVVMVTEDGRYHLWASCHPLETAEHADRMTTDYATSEDGVRWTWQGTVLAPRPGRWDARGVRVTSVVFDGADVVAGYDGRATAAENWEERTGYARATYANGLVGPFTAEEEAPIGSPFPPHGLRYLSVVDLPAGGRRMYYEITRADGAHELRTQLVD